MKMYKVVKTYKYTEVVYVEASSDKEAENLAMSSMADQAERVDDDWLYDCVAYEQQ